MKKMAWIVIVFVVVVVGYSMSIAMGETPTEEVGTTEALVTDLPVEETEAPEVILGFLDDLGYTDDEVAAMKEILVNVGITEVLEPEIGNESYGMRSIKGIAYTDGWLATPKEVLVRINIENGVIYMVHIYCPSYGTSSQPTYLKGLSDRRADLYYDGYLKRIDWDNKEVVDY